MRRRVGIKKIDKIRDFDLYIYAFKKAEWLAYMYRLIKIEMMEMIIWVDLCGEKEKVFKNLTLIMVHWEKSFWKITILLEKPPQTVKTQKITILYSKFYNTV